jgi:hypothetical protein
VLFDRSLTLSHPNMEMCVLHRMHAHGYGRAIRVQHVRAGAELAEIDRNDHYDAMYQTMTDLTDPKRTVTLHANDSLRLTCVYDTSNR